MSFFPVQKKEIVNFKLLVHSFVFVHLLRRSNVNIRILIYD